MIIDRTTAELQGLRRYFTGKPCLNGHIAERYISTGSCVVCAKENQCRVALEELSSGLSPLTAAERLGRVGTYSNLKADEAEAWYAQIEAIRRGKRFLFGSREVVNRKKPLDERAVIFAAPKSKAV